MRPGSPRIPPTSNSTKAVLVSTPIRGDSKVRIRKNMKTRDLRFLDSYSTVVSLAKARNTMPGL